MDSSLSAIALPDDAPARLRRALGTPPGDRPRIAFAHGSGDVEGSFAHWRAGRHDPRVPVATYANMFFDLIAGTDAEGLVITHRPLGDDAPRMGAGAPVAFANAPAPAGRGALAYYRAALLSGRAIGTTLAAFRPDIVVISSFWPAVVWPMSGPARRRILSMHNTFWPMGPRPEGLKARLKAGVTARCARALDAAVCTSHECARQLAALTDPDRMTIAVEYPQMLARFDARDRTQVREVLYLGRIERSKGVFMLVDAVEAINREGGPPLRLTIAGSGGAQDALRQRLDGAPGDAVRFVGRLAADAVHAALDETDLLVCPTMTSFNEGLALVCFEAAAHGAPSIASSVVPAREALEDCCVTFPADDQAALTDAIRRIAGDPALYRRLCAATAPHREGLQDRSLSWGARLFEAMTA